MERAINNDLQHHLIFSVNKVNVITRYRTLAQQGSLIHKNMTPPIKSLDQCILITPSNIQINILWLWIKLVFVFRDSGLNRRFFIQNNYGGCSNDAGWFLVVESNTCAWEQRTTRPYFIYSGKSGRDLQDSKQYVAS